MLLATSQYSQYFAIFTGKRLCWSLFLIKLHTFRQVPIGHTRKVGLRTHTWDLGLGTHSWDLGSGTHRQDPKPIGQTHDPVPLPGTGDPGLISKTRNSGPLPGTLYLRPYMWGPMGTTPALSLSIIWMY